MILQTFFIQESRDKAIVERAISNPLENYIHFISCYNRLVRIFHLQKEKIAFKFQKKQKGKPCNSFWS